MSLAKCKGVISSTLSTAVIHINPQNPQKIPLEKFSLPARFAVGWGGAEFAPLYLVGAKFAPLHIDF